jgi:hypothetical protein
MNTKAISIARPSALSLLMQRALAPFRTRRHRALTSAAPEDSRVHGARSMAGKRVWIQVAGWMLVPVLLGSMALAAFVFRQDIELMMTMRTLRAAYGPTHVYRIEYCDDGWTQIDILGSYELRSPAPNEEPVAAEQQALVEPLSPGHGLSNR